MSSINRLLELKNLVIGPRCFPRLWKSVQVTEPLDQHQEIRHLAQETANTILLKVMTSILPVKKTNTGMNDWAAASRWSNWWMKFPSPNLQKRHGSSGAPVPDYSTAWCLLKDICLSWRRRSAERERWVKKKRKMTFSSPLFLPVAAADGVDQRKVTEGKMHIEKALGNIWCRRQSGLYHSSAGEKKLDAEKYGCPPVIRHSMYHNVGFLIRGANLSERFTCLRCPAVNGVWTREFGALVLSAKHRTNEPNRRAHQLLSLCCLCFSSSSVLEI